MNFPKNKITICFMVIIILSLFSFGISVYSYSGGVGDGNGDFDTPCFGCHSSSSTPGDTVQLFVPVQAEAESNINVTLNVTLGQGGIIHLILFDANTSNNDILTENNSNWIVILDPHGRQNSTINASVTASQPTNFTWTIKAKAAGIFALGARIYWGISLPGYHFDAQEVYVKITTTDTVPPTINITSHSNGTIVSNSVTVSANITDDEEINLVKFELNNSEISHVLKGNDIYEATIDTTSYTNGPYEVKITAKDTGNEVSKIVILLFENEEISADFVAHKVTGGQAPVIGDGTIAEIWEDVERTSVTEFGDGGYAQFLHDGTYIYALFAFQEDILWVAIWIESDEDCMGTEDDGWVFGQGSVTTFVGDVYYIGSKIPIVDDRNDVSFESIEGEEIGIKMIEIKRLLSSEDTEGRDISFELDTVYNIKFASESYHIVITTFTLVLVSTPPSGEQPTTSTTSTISPGQQKAIRQTTMLILGSVGTLVIVAFVGAIILFDRRGRK